MARFKRSNLSNPTIHFFNNSIPYTSRTELGGQVIGTDIVGSAFLGRRASIRNTENKGENGPGIKVEKRSSNSKMTRNMSGTYVRNNLKVPTRTIGGPNGRGGRVSGSILDVIVSGLDMSNQIDINIDINTAANQFDTYNEIIGGVIAKGIQNGTIPESFQNEKMLSDLGNYIFQGEFNGNYDEDTFNNMQSTAELLIQSAPGCELKCEGSPQYIKD